MRILQNGKAECSVQAVPENFPVLQEWLEKLLAETDFPLHAVQQILICTDEIFTNIVSYAYPSGTGAVSVSVEHASAERKITLVFRDQGIAFDPLNQAGPDLSVPVSKRKIGGVGLLVVRKMMDSVSYLRDGDSNVLTLIKYAEESAKPC